MITHLTERFIYLSKIIRYLMYNFISRWRKNKVLGGKYSILYKSINYKMRNKSTAAQFRLSALSQDNVKKKKERKHYLVFTRNREVAVYICFKYSFFQKFAHETLKELTYTWGVICAVLSSSFILFYRNTTAIAPFHICYNFTCIGVERARNEK